MRGKLVDSNNSNPNNLDKLIWISWSKDWGSKAPSLVVLLTVLILLKTKQIDFFVIMWQIVMIKNGHLVPVNNWNNGANVMEKIRNNIG